MVCLKRREKRKAKFMSACVLTFVLTATVGCTSTKADSPEMALLATSSQSVATSGADSMAVIETAIGQWFGGMDITLADTAFTASSTLSIERKGAMDKRSLPIDGRHSNPAFVFTLLKRGDECFIRNEQNNEEMLLDGVDCVAVKR